MQNKILDSEKQNIENSPAFIKFEREVYKKEGSYYENSFMDPFQTKRALYATCICVSLPLYWKIFSNYKTIIRRPIAAICCSFVTGMFLNQGVYKLNEQPHHYEIYSKDEFNQIAKLLQLKPHPSQRISFLLGSHHGLCEYFDQCNFRVIEKDIIDNGRERERVLVYHPAI